MTLTLINHINHQKAKTKEAMSIIQTTLTKMISTEIIMITINQLTIRAERVITKKRFITLAVIKITGAIGVTVEKIIKETIVITAIQTMGIMGTMIIKTIMNKIRNRISMKIRKKKAIKGCTLVPVQDQRIKAIRARLSIQTITTIMKIIMISTVEEPITKVASRAGILIEATDP
jgi:hypothetical protein